MCCSKIAYYVSPNRINVFWPMMPSSPSHEIETPYKLRQANSRRLAWKVKKSLQISFPQEQRFDSPSMANFQSAYCQKYIACSLWPAMHAWHDDWDMQVSLVLLETFNTPKPPGIISNGLISHPTTSNADRYSTRTHPAAEEIMHNSGCLWEKNRTPRQQCTCIQNCS